MSTTAPKSSEARRGADAASWRTLGGDLPDKAQQGNARSRGRGGGRNRVRQRGPPKGLESKESITSIAAPHGGDSNATIAQKPSSLSTSPRNTTAGPEKASLKAVRLPLTVKVSSSVPLADPKSPLSPSKASSRRRRNQKRNSSTQVPQENLPQVSHPRELPVSPLVPSVPQPELSVNDPKDLPPHLVDTAVPVTTSPDTRNDNPIDSLVEHVRSMAMEKHRPDSPSKHIDWAGDDDEDSLPDLEDWGFSSKLSSEMNASGKMVTPSSSVNSGEKAMPASVPLAEVKATGNSPASPVIKHVGDSTSESRSASPVAKRERKRERGSRRGGERRGRNGQPVNGTDTAALPASTANPPKKSLLERLSSPVRPNRIKHRSPSRSSVNRSPPTSHPPLPSKPVNVVDSHLPPSKGTAAWGIEPIETSPARNRPASPQSSDTAVASYSPERKDDTVAKLDIDINADVMKPVEEFQTSTFDWSEEPADIEISHGETGPGPELEIQPPTPNEEFPRSDGRSTGSARPPHHQRPFSTDTTPRHRRERSPHKVHNARNHSTPNAVPPADNARARPPRATRPVIRSDVLAMLSRSLRDPPPPRRESPNPPPST